MVITCFAVIDYELVSYLLFYSSACCVTIKELFICKNSIFIGDTEKILSFYSFSHRIILP
ncbi:hypothetical protein EC81_014840 [Bacteroides fragilis]|nr:hypothetical protein EC81_014840 [Bacteroides fragilis]